MALDGTRLIDPFDGRADIDRRLVRAVGDPEERFAEDPLRMLRAARFVAQLDFELDAATADAARSGAPRLLDVARERWVIELDKLLMGPAVGRGLRALADTGQMRYLLPELELQVDYDQNSRYHDRTLFEHTVGVVEATPPDVTLRWAALLHDVGKPFVRAEKPGRSTYLGHDALGAELAERTALYLKWGTKRRVDVVRLVAGHMDAESALRAADDAAKPPTTR
jgi:putative nucleotidyltransferase with HDIG domain